MKWIQIIQEQFALVQNKCKFIRKVIIKSWKRRIPSIKTTKIFRTVQEKLTILGIGPNQSKSNGKLVMTCLIFGLVATSSTIFLVAKANTFHEYTSNVYVTTGVIMLCITLAVMIFNMEFFFKLIDDFGKYIDKSENENFINWNIPF